MRFPLRQNMGNNINAFLSALGLVSDEGDPLDVDIIDTGDLDRNINGQYHGYFNINRVMVDDLWELIVTGLLHFHSQLLQLRLTLPLPQVSALKIVLIDCEHLVKCTDSQWCLPRLYLYDFVLQWNDIVIKRFNFVQTLLNIKSTR